MSSLEDRERALREDDYTAAADKVVKQLELKERRRVGQGEFLGDMIAGFGAFAGGRGRLLVIAAQLTIMLSVGAMLVLVLLPVA